MPVTAKLGNAQVLHGRVQLSGSGRTVTVQILVNGKALSTVTASGGYNIATAQICHGSIVGEWESCT